MNVTVYTTVRQFQQENCFNVTVILADLECIKVNEYWHLDPIATDYGVFWIHNDFIQVFDLFK